MINQKRIAKEWLIVVISIFIGFTITFFIRFNNSYDYIEKRTVLFNKLHDEFDIESFDIESFDEFSKQLDEPQTRKEFYNLISEKYNLGTFTTFEEKVTRTRLSNTLVNFFDSGHLIPSTIIILLPYLLFQFFRSLIWSISKVRNKN